MSEGARVEVEIVGEDDSAQVNKVHPPLVQRDDDDPVGQHPLAQGSPSRIPRLPEEHILCRLASGRRPA